MITAFIFLALAALAADDAAKPAPDRAAMTLRHEKMAEIHRRTADCLKAGKSVEACHEAMHSAMPMKGEGCAPGQGCPMCGARGGRGKGMGKGMRMGRPGPKPAPANDEPKP